MIIYDIKETMRIGLAMFISACLILVVNESSQPTNEAWDKAMEKIKEDE